MPQKRNSWVPERKVGAGLGVGAMLGVVIVWVLNTFALPQEHPVPGQIGAAIGSICSFAVAYFLPARSGRE